MMYLEDVSERMSSEEGLRLLLPSWGDRRPKETLSVSINNEESVFNTNSINKWRMVSRTAIIQMNCNDGR